MISSEVQRTLVKSPPELWAEISDPQALGRHLGELGEIRITRSQPEELVEWESDSARGTISIKPSAWGTRVKLTAARELPVADEAAGDATAEAQPEVHAEAHPEVPAEAQPETHAEAHPEVPAVAQPEVHAEAEPEVNLELGVAAQVDWEPELQAPAEPAVQVEPEPALEVEPEAAVQAEPEAALQAEAEPEPTAAMPPATPAGAMSAWAHQEADSFEGPAAVSTPGEPAMPVETLEEPPAAAAEQLPEGTEPTVPERRGFFARLFGRRSRQKPVHPSSAGMTSDTDLRIAREAARRRLEATLAMPEAGLQARPGEPEEVTAEHAWIEPMDEGGIEPIEDAPIELVDEAGIEPMDAGVELAALDSHAASATEVPEAEMGETQSAGTSAEPVSDLASELREAEETAAEEVRAVLSAVLDRLGAAHHRPFSRG